MRTLLVAALLCGTAAPAWAQPGDKARIAALEEQVRVLKGRLDAIETERRGRVPRAASVTAPVAATSPSPAKPMVPAPAMFAATPTRNNAGLAVVPVSSLDRALQDVGTWAEISASNDSSQVAIKLSGTTSDPNLRGRGVGTATYSTWGLTASAPLNSGGRSDIGTLDGFVNSSKLKLRLTNYWVQIADPQKTARGTTLIAAAREACKTQGGSGCDDAIVGDEFAGMWLGKPAQDEYLKLAFPASMSWGAGLEGSIGYKKFSYLDLATGNKADSERVPWGIKGFVSALPGGEVSSITAGLEYQRSYKERDSITLCPAIALLGLTQCLTGPGGTPTTNEKLLTSLEYRRQFLLSKDGFFKSLGISTQLTYDVKNDVFGIDVPIYFSPYDKSDLIGGIRFGYVSADHNFVAGVFVSSAFSIFQ